MALLVKCLYQREKDFKNQKYLSIFYIGKSIFNICKFKIYYSVAIWTCVLFIGISSLMIPLDVAMLSEVVYKERVGEKTLTTIQ